MKSFRGRQLPAECLQFGQCDVDVARFTQRAQYGLERRSNPQYRRGQIRPELADDRLHSATGIAQLVQFFGINSQPGPGLMAMPRSQVSAQVRQSDLENGRG